MLIHCTMEELLAIRDGYGNAAAKEHLESCEECMMEMERLYQTVAALKALPSLDAPRDRWPEVRRRALAERKSRKKSILGWSGLAAAAITTLLLGFQAGVMRHQADPRIAGLMEESQNLEGVLRSIKPDSRVINGRVASTVVRLEDQIDAIDRRLSDLDAQRNVQAEIRTQQLENLWRQRVRLMESLVTVHSNRATYVRF
jgi:anti-sigma factor RsiW